MKKILFTLLITLFLIPGVNAEVDACYNDYLIDVNSDSWITKYTAYYDKETDTWKTTSSKYFNTLKYLFPIEPGKTYYLKLFDLGTDDYLLSTPYKLYDSDLNYFTTTSLTYSYDTINFQFTITIPDNLETTPAYMNLVFRNYEVDMDSFMASPIAFADFDLSTCPTTSEPEVPDEVIIVDSTLDDFYSIYTSKLQAFAQYATENKFILGAIAILLLIIVLEIILNLFRKGGYH